MATTDDISKVMRLVIIQAILKYSGGNFTGKGSKGRVTQEASGTIINSHFTKSNAGRYPPLSEAYLIQKIKKVGKRPILVYSGDMKRSIVGKGKVWAMGNNVFKLTFPNVVPYAKHHTGGMGKLKKRHPTALNAKDKAAFQRALKNSLKTAMERLGKAKTTVKVHPSA